MDRLSTGEKILGASALLLFVLSFFGIWAKVEVSAGGGLEAFGDFDTTQRFNAWDAYGFLVKLGFVFALVAAALVIVRAAGSNLNLPVSYGRMYLVLGGLTFVFMLLALVIGPDESGSGDFLGVKVEISRGLGLFIGTALAAAMAAGAWLHYKGEEGGVAATGTGYTPTSTPPAGPTPPAP